jgi:hypothetical protein
MASGLCPLFKVVIPSNAPAYNRQGGQFELCYMIYS